jgi:hypothetical protein
VRKIFVRSDPWRAVVKPYPRENTGMNLLEAESREAALQWAQNLAERHGWPIVDETQPAETPE